MTQPRADRARRWIGRRSRADSDIAIDSRPALGAEVSVAAAESPHWIVSVAGVPVSRVSESVTELLQALDGRSTLSALRDVFAPDHSDAEFVALIRRFAASGLLDSAARRGRGRFVYRPPLTVQLATLSAPRVFAVLDRVTAALWRVWFASALGIVTIAGVFAFFLQAADVITALGSPVRVTSVVTVGIVLVVATLAHEAAHGAILTRLGGKARRAGFMLLYLSPAFFVDVTDGWRLHRWARVAVALAGPAVHTLLGGIAALLALTASDDHLRATLLILAFASFTVVGVNLIPFVRFDGYLALMSALDEPGLRARTMADAAHFLSRILFGTPRATPAVGRWWSVPFGVASAVTPAILIVLALERISRSLQGAGPVAAAVVLVLHGLVGIVVVVLLFRFVVRARRSGARLPRILTVGAAAVMTFAVVTMLVQVPQTLSIGYVVRGDSVRLVRSVPSAVPDGAPVTLSENGILWTTAQSEGRVVDSPIHPVQIPLTAVMPIQAPMTVAGYDVGAVEIDGSARRHLSVSGRAVIELGTTTLLSALWESSAASPAREIWGVGSRVPTVSGAQRESGASSG